MRCLNPRGPEHPQHKPERRHKMIIIIRQLITEKTHKVPYFRNYSATMKQPNDPSLWQRNDIQYPRLIAEILASDALDDKSRTMICDSMDLQPNHLQDLLTRAQHDWTTIKKTVLSTKQPPATLRCPHCKYNGKRPTENGQGFRYLSDQTTWREVSSLK